MKNFKNVQELTLDLSNFAILQGPNGSGKTTIIQALLLAIEGRLPRIHDKELFAELAREGEEVNEMSVGLKREDFSFTRRWVCKEKFDNNLGKRLSTISCDIEIYPFIADENLTQKKERIKELISLNPISVDIENFLGLSDAKRRDFFYELGETEKLTPEKIKWQFEKVEIPVDDFVKRAWDRNKHDVLITVPDEPDLELILNGLANGISTKTAEKRQCEMTARRMIEVKARRNAVGGHLKDLEGMLVELQNKWTDLEKNIESNKAKAEVVKLTDERKNEYTQRIINLEKHISDDAQEVASLNESLGELDAKVAKTKSEFDKKEKKGEKEILKQENKIDDLRKVKDALISESGINKARQASLESSVDQHKPYLSKKSLEYLEGKKKEFQDKEADGEQTSDSIMVQIESLTKKLIS